MCRRILRLSETPPPRSSPTLPTWHLERRFPLTARASRKEQLLLIARALAHRPVRGCKLDSFCASRQCLTRAQVHTSRRPRVGRFGCAGIRAYDSRRQKQNKESRSMQEFLWAHWHVALGIIVALFLLLTYRWWLWLFGVIIVPDDSVGVVTKKFVLLRSHRNLPDGRIIALNGEAGFQADALPPGLHIGLWPWQYRVELVKFFTVPQGKIGCVESCDGQPLPSGRIIAKQVTCDFYQDARAFLTNGGERGPQMTVIPPGTYRINPLLFTVSLSDAVIIPPGKIGVVEARDGKPLPSGRVIARHVECDSFQDGNAFMSAGGQRGPQTALIAPGSYRINPMLFAVQLTDVVDIPD